MSAVLHIPPIDPAAAAAWAAIVAELRIDERGRKIFWPEPIDLNGDPVVDIDADGLHAMAQS